MTALALALLFSAFCKPRTAEHTGSEGAALVWYAVGTSGSIDPNLPMNPDDPMTAGEFQSTYYPLCSTGDEVDCVRGFYSGTPPTSGYDMGIEQLRKDL